nr:retron-type RNA-directed DNA polymerase [uncultured bacterium]
MTPRCLATTLHSLPPILHISCPMSIQSCSEGSRGLFVPLRVIGIFTDTTISPSSWLRQCPDRYTIRAGRNLPDKEFRYLRTVIVTAAVYWGFNSMLRRS